MLLYTACIYNKNKTEASASIEPLITIIQYSPFDEDEFIITDALLHDLVCLAQQGRLKCLLTLQVRHCHYQLTYT